MKKKIFTLFAIASLSLFSACSDDASSDPTREELCQAGLSFDCLADGLWKLNGVTETTVIGADTLKTINPNHNFSASPATLFLSKDGNFTYTPSPLMEEASCNEGNIYGEWSVKENKLTIRTKIGNTCLASKSFTKEVVVKRVGPNFEFDIQGIFFLNSEIEAEDKAIKESSTEIYFINAQ